MQNRGIEFAAPGEMRFYDLGEPPSPGYGEILLRTLYSGITNGTERHTLMAEHGWTHFPGRHGYQHVARVEAIGEGVQGFQVGDHVFYGQYVGHRAWHLVKITGADPHDYRSHLCLRLPEGITLEPCALLGVAGVAMRAVRRCRVEAAQRVWIVGAGLIGQFAAQAARASGAHVTITDINRCRLERARGWGVHRAIDATSSEYEAAIRAGGPYDRILDASGIPSLFEDIQRLGLLAYRGVIGAIAVRRKTCFDWTLLHGLEASIEVSCHFSLNDLERVLFFLQMGEMTIEPLIAHRVPVEEAPAIYRLLRDAPHELLGVVFDWGVSSARSSETFAHPLSIPS